MTAVKIIKVLGASEESWQAAAEEAVQKASTTIDEVHGVVPSLPLTPVVALVRVLDRPASDEFVVVKSVSTVNRPLLVGLVALVMKLHVDFDAHC